MDDIGVDINSSWAFNEEGDLELISDEKNMVQSIRNRLTCWLGSMDLYYLEYGSILSNFLGWKHRNETLEFIKLEVEKTLRQDPRMPEYTLEVAYDDSGRVIIELLLHYTDADYPLSLVITKDGSINILDENEENVSGGE